MIKKAAAVSTLLSFLYATAGVAEPVRLLASFSKVESASGEHCDGWDVRIFKVGERYVGELDHHRGLCGDPPFGFLRDIRYRPSDGMLSFAATISEGVDQYNRPTCDELRFKGHIKNDRLRGNLVWEWDKKTTSEWLDLLQVDGAREDYPDEAAWLKSREEILRLRGPRCRSKD